MFDNTFEVKKEAIRLKQLLERYKKELLIYQEKCKHKNVAEKQYNSDNDYYCPLPPVRVCCDCGIQEEGWGCGYKNLKEKDGRAIVTIGSKAWYEIRNEFVTY